MATSVKFCHAAVQQTTEKLKIVKTKGERATEYNSHSLTHNAVLNMWKKNTSIVRLARRVAKAMSSGCMHL